MNPMAWTLTAGAGATHTEGSHRQSNLMLGGVDFMMLACRELPSFWQLHQKWP
jgi:hypothetical protein